VASYASSFAFTNTLQTLTKDRVVSDLIVETFFDSAAIWQYLRMAGNYQDMAGGLAFTWAVNVSGSPNTISFVGDDNLPIVSMDTNMIRAALDPKFYADALVLKLTDTALNNGSPDAVTNYAESQMDIVKMSIVNKMADDLVNNYQTLNSKSINGLIEAVDDGTGKTTSYANITRSTYTTFKAKINWASATSTEVADLQTQFLNAQIDNDKPDFFAINRKGFQNFWSTLVAKDQYIQPDLSRTFGGLNLMYQGNPMFMDSHVPTSAAAPSGGGSGGIVFALNSNYLTLACLDNWNFRMTEWREAEQNATIYSRIFWGGNLVCQNPRAQAAIWVSGL
jgi:hypothetical protein